MQKIFFISIFIYLLPLTSFTQKDSVVYFKGAIKENRNTLLRKIQHSINRNLSLVLNDDTEENWVDAFGAMELVHYKSLWADGKIINAFDSIEKRSTYYRRALLELAYTSYPDRFIKQVTSLLNHESDAKIFALCAEYLLLKNNHLPPGFNLENRMRQLAKNEKDSAILRQLSFRIHHPTDDESSFSVSSLLNPDFLKGHTILYSFQRKNRDYPGIALIRDCTGNFVKDSNGLVFSVPQLARSINNLPGYLTNGNTPQGIFRMYGFDTSKTYFIGPTTNIQLTMPFETSLRHFFNDSTITDTVWSEDWYRKLLPVSLRNSGPIYESFYAGKAGRTEIIAHGTTIDPNYYSGEIYYPQTPTVGCLCTKEIWSEEDGKRLDSDQQKLTVALKTAGGPDGYCVVIEINDAHTPVSISEISTLLKYSTIK